MRILPLLVLLLMSFDMKADITISGNVKAGGTGLSLPNVTVRIDGSNKAVSSDLNGFYTITAKSNSKVKLKFTGVGYKAVVKEIETTNENITLDAELIEKVVTLEMLYVYGATRRPEKITESPAAVTVLFQEDLEKKSRQGQIANVLSGNVGVDVLRNGATDYIVNTRGFNGGLNRRLLVLQDGRDVAMPLLGAMEWNSFAVPAEDFESIELVRGPGAALYGANAFNGVLLMKSAAPKSILGTKISVLGGDFETYKADIRSSVRVMDNLYAKANLGYSSMLNLVNRRDSAKFLEYPGLVPERRVLKEEDRTTTSMYGSLRLDYDISETSYITAEGGYSRSGNEAYVFGLGRTFVKDVERPYLRLAYNSERINVHAHYMNRFVPDTMWLMVPNAPLLDDSKDMLIDFQHNFYITENVHFIWGITEQVQNIRTFGTSIPNDVDADYTGVYAQFNWKLNDNFKVVASSRFDYASIHESQFSPRVSFVWSPSGSQNFRLSFNKAFQRPNYSELYRLTPDAPAMMAGKPVNFAAVESMIADSISKLSGTRPTLNLNLNALRARAVGNEDLEVEKIMAFEIGYNGSFGANLFISADMYYNRLNDFITTFLPGVNESIPSWSPNLPDSLLAYSGLVRSMVMSSLSPNDQKRLSYLDGVPTFVVSNANVGIVDEYGIELEAIYQFCPRFNLKADYSYFGYDVVENKSSQPLLPNTAPHRFGLTANFKEAKSFDVSASLYYSESFDWLAGVYKGKVPAYAVVNLNAGYNITNDLSIGVNVFNLLNRKHYQVFGGTYMPRMATARISFEF